ncbi:glycosyltransferase family 2 protein [Acetobacter malorum]|uniref:glycosyltransferase n=1 Tax=Acetobacter malorum TaxID=178901 RepID=UPI0009EE5805|nr:glycosyltransferase [Acetobacter malorum]
MSFHDPDNGTTGTPSEILRQSPFWKKQRIIAIPACNEEEHIIPCLIALATQSYVLPDKVVLWLNNTTDKTYDLAHSLQDKLPFALEIVQVVYHPDLASAGIARREALAHAARHAPHDALLFTTDADAEVSKGWIYRTLEAFVSYSVEAVFGRALLLPSEAEKIPLHLHQDEQAEQAYGALLEQITVELCPEPHDPWPRHIEHSGASIAVTRQAWAQVDGIPNVPTGEDRQFYKILKQNGIPVRHAPDVVVYVSARLSGRAQGGMAETLARRIRAQDDYIDEVFETVSSRLLRIRKEQAYRFKNQSQPVVTECPPTRIRRDDLENHVKRAQRVLRFLRQTRARCSANLERQPADQYDSYLPAP